MLLGDLQDAKNYGWEVNENVNFNWKKLLHKKVVQTFFRNIDFYVRDCAANIPSIFPQLGSGEGVGRPHPYL